MYYFKAKDPGGSRLFGGGGGHVELPIYCVERDQKMLSISFDAAWGDGKERRLEHKGVPGAALFTQKSRTG